GPLGVPAPSRHHPPTAPSGGDHRRRCRVRLSRGRAAVQGQGTAVQGSAGLRPRPAPPGPGRPIVAGVGPGAGPSRARLAETAARPSLSWRMIEAMDEPVPSQRHSQASGPQPIEIMAYDPAWPARFAGLGREPRAGLGGVPRRIDPTGPTAVPGLAAKPIIDIQVSVANFEPL